jgi:hypothetical protein
MRRASPTRDHSPFARRRSGSGRALLIAGGLLAAACSHKARTATPTAAPPAEAAIAVQSIPDLQPLPGEKVAAFDPGHTGRPTLWKYTVVVGEGQERVVRKERDLNGDGKIDIWEAYDEDGNVSKQVCDLDFDGKPDLVVTYEKGLLVKKELAPGFDGMARTVAYFENGKLVRKERDRSGAGKIDTWEYYENGELDRIGYDDDGDGQVDRWEKREAGEKDGSAEAAGGAGTEKAK